MTSLTLQDKFAKLYGKKKNDQIFLRMEKSQYELMQLIFKRYEKQRSQIRNRYVTKFKQEHKILKNVIPNYEVFQIENEVVPISFSNEKEVTENNST